MERFITKPNFKRLLKGIIKDTVLVAPAAPYGEVVLQRVDSVDNIVFDYENTLNSPKDLLLLNDETLFKYKETGSGLIPQASGRRRHAKAEDIVVFGLRPCDTRAIGLLDKFFSRAFKDEPYFHKRKRMLVITYACAKLRSGCFCTSTHSGPYLKGDFDIQIMDLDSGYFIETGSAKGSRLIEKFSGLMSRVSDTKKAQKRRLIKAAASSKKIEFDLKKVYVNMSSQKTDKRLWQDLAQRCQSCGGCLLICPTCSCFHVVDKNSSNGTTQRVRSLDACYYEGFTRIAGGQNPISTRSLMMKRKFYHKLKQQMDEFEECGCTGCGRCNDICPGNVGWLDVIKSIEKPVRKE